MTLDQFATGNALGKLTILKHAIDHLRAAGMNSEVTEKVWIGILRRFRINKN